MEIREEFEALVIQHHDRLVGWLNKHTRDRALAEDVAQEAYLHLWRNRQTVQTWGPAILYKGAQFRLSEHYRKQQRRSHRHAPLPVDELDEALTIAMPDFADDFGAREDARQQLAMVKAALGPVYAETLLLRVGGMEYEQIAAYLGIPLGTVRSRLNYARAQARKLRSA